MWRGCVPQNGASGAEKWRALQEYFGGFREKGEGVHAAEDFGQDALQEASTKRGWPSFCEHRGPEHALGLPAGRVERKLREIRFSREKVD